MSETDARVKLDAVGRSTREKLEENSARDKQGLDAVEEKHTYLVQARSNQTCQGRKLGMELEAGVERIKEQEKEAKARRNLISDVNSVGEAKALEVGKNDDYLESLFRKTATDEDCEMRLLMGLKDRKSLVQDKMSNAEKDVDQLRRNAAKRQHEMANLKEGVGNLKVDIRHSQPSSEGCLFAKRYICQAIFEGLGFSQLANSDERKLRQMRLFLCPYFLQCNFPVYVSC